MTECVHNHLMADLLAVSVRPIAGAMQALVTVRGRLPEGQVVAEQLMAELAELDCSVNLRVALGKWRRQ